MSKVRSCLGFVVFLLVLSCIELEIVRFVAARLPGERAPQRDFEDESLLMDATLFPAGWWDHAVTTRPLTKWVYSDGCHAYQELYAFYYVVETKRLYERYLGSKFGRREHYEGEWQPRPDLCQQLTFADECYAACAFWSIEWAEHYQYRENDKQKCRVLARYQEFVILFHAPGAPYLTFEDLANVLRGIDQRFAAAMELKGAPHKPPGEERP